MHLLCLLASCRYKFFHKEQCSRGSKRRTEGPLQTLELQEGEGGGLKQRGESQLIKDGD